MLAKILADLVLLLHLAFILFVLFGVFIVFKKHKLAWVHVPVVIWGILISLFRWVCPLTPLENYFRMIAGEQGYEGGFIANYILPLVYPAGMTRELAISMGVFVLVWNGLLYVLLIYLIKKK